MTETESFILMWSAIFVIFGIAATVVYFVNRQISKHNEVRFTYSNDGGLSSSNEDYVPSQAHLGVA